MPHLRRRRVHSCKPRRSARNRAQCAERLGVSTHTGSNSHRHHEQCHPKTQWAWISTSNSKSKCWRTRSSVPMCPAHESEHVHLFCLEQWSTDAMDKPNLFRVSIEVDCHFSNTAPLTVRAFSSAQTAAWLVECEYDTSYRMVNKHTNKVKSADPEGTDSEG